jgi:hypothetical protein
MFQLPSNHGCFKKLCGAMPIPFWELAFLRLHHFRSFRTLVLAIVALCEAGLGQETGLKPPGHQREFLSTNY